MLQRSLSLLLLPLVSRALTPQEFGVVATVVVTVSVVNVVLAAPFEIALFRSVVRSEDPTLIGTERHSRRYLTRTVPIVALLSAACIYAGSIVASGRFDSHGQLWALEVAAAGFLAAITSYGLTVARASDQLGTFVAVSGLWSLTLVALKAILVVAVDMGALGWILADLLASGIGYALVMRKIAKNRKSLESPGGSWRSVASTALALVPHRLSFWVLASITRPLCSLLFPSSSVGIFAMAVSLASVSLLVLAELNNAVLLNYASEDSQVPTVKTSGVARVQFLLSSVIPSAYSLALLFVAPWVVGKSFSDAVPLVSFMLIGHIAYGIYVIPMNYIVHASGRVRLSSSSSTAGAIAVIVFMVISGRLGSLTLAALSPSVGYVVMMGVAFLLNARIELVDDWRFVFPRWFIFVPWLLTPFFCLAFLASTTGGLFEELLHGRAQSIFGLLGFSSLLLVSAAACLPNFAFRTFHGSQSAQDRPRTPLANHGA